MIPPTQTSRPSHDLDVAVCVVGSNPENRGGYSEADAKLSFILFGSVEPPLPFGSEA